MANFTITREQAQLPEYLARLDDEIEAGNIMSPMDLKARRIEDPRIVRYKAKMAAGSPENSYVGWLDHLVGRFAPFNKCLSIGAGRGRVEQHLVEIGLCREFEALDVYVQQDDVSTHGSIASDFMDLNFATLKPGGYDFILCHGVLHHLINLEFIFDQINIALKPNGRVLIYEYIGERQWQFSDERMLVLRQRFPNVRFERVPRWAVAGFESIRSDELLHLIELVFGSSTLYSASFGGIYFPFLTCTKGDYDVLLDDVIAYDHEAQVKNLISPCYHVGIYGKTDKTAPRAIPWSDTLLKERLHRPFPFNQAVLRSLRRSALGPLLRKAKRAVIG